MKSFAVGSIWRVPKIHEGMEDCQDSIAFSLDNQVFCIADGVTQSFQSGLWSRILTTTFIEERELLYFDNWKQWIKKAQGEWLASVNKLQLELREASKSTWIELSNGLADRRPAASTFVGLRIIDNYIHGICLGDSCALFFELAYELSDTAPRINLISIYPNKYSNRFTSRTSTFLSYEEYKGGHPSIFQVPVPDGCSFILLATDSLAEYIINSLNGDSLSIGILKAIAGNNYSSFVHQARYEGMKNDDTSLLLIHSQSSEIFDVLTNSSASQDYGLDPVEGESYENRQSYPTISGHGKARVSDVVDQDQQDANPFAIKEDEHVISNQIVCLDLSSHSPIDGTPRYPEVLGAELLNNSDIRNTEE
jgi:hypothetical protein